MVITPRFSLSACTTPQDVVTGGQLLLLSGWQLLGLVLSHFLQWSLAISQLSHAMPTNSVPSTFTQLKVYHRYLPLRDPIHDTALSRHYLQRGKLAQFSPGRD
jgi:hypothetical protein